MFLKSPCEIAYFLTTVCLFSLVSDRITTISTGLSDVKVYNYHHHGHSLFGAVRATFENIPVHIKGKYGIVSWGKRGQKGFTTKNYLYYTLDLRYMKFYAKINRGL